MGCFLLHLFSVRCSADLQTVVMLSARPVMWSERASMRERCCSAHDCLEQLTSRHYERAFELHVFCFVDWLDLKKS